MKKLSALLAAMLMAALLLTACGDNNSSNGGGASSGAGTGNEGGTTEPSTSGQEIIFALHNEPDGIDPNVTNNSFASPILANVFEGLVTYDTTTGELIPGVAESWDISEDGTVYTFHLREGLKWSDGTDLTAEDFVYSIQRLLTPETTAQYLEMASDYILNAEAYYDGDATEEELGVKAIDANTLEITLEGPTPFFIDVLSIWCFSPVQKATIEANGDAWTSSADTYVVNGPFMISEMNMGESYVLVPNPYYYDADKVQLEKITFRFIPDMATALNAYESGEIQGQRSIPATDLARLKTEDSGLMTAPSYAVTYFEMNNAKEPLNDPKVREAISLAVDRNAIINDVLNNGGSPAYALLPPGYAVDGKDITDGRGNFGLSSTADVEAAQAALAEAGYPDGEGFPTITVSYYTNDNAKKMAEAIAEMLRTNLNINVEIDSADWAVFFDDVMAGNYDIAAMGMGGDYLHPMTFLPIMTTGNTLNNSFYSNAEYDALIAQVINETDPSKAADLMMQADAIVAAEYPQLYLFYRSNTCLLDDSVQGAYLSTLDFIYFKNAYVVE